MALRTGRAEESSLTDVDVRIPRRAPAHDDAV
jgi:hypothetical protein